MKLQEIYDLAIEMGIKADPRGEKAVEKALERVKKEYKELSEKKKKFFDKETLTNPYGDTRIAYGNLDTEVKKLAAGIDAETAEILLVDRLNQKGSNIDLLITHHPHGSGLPGVAEVMGMQAEYFSNMGVPANVSYALIKERQTFISRRFKTIPNHGQTIDSARLLDIPLLCLHTAWDNLGSKFMMDYIAKKTYDTVDELLEHVLEIPEFEHAAREKAAPFITAGSGESPTGKILVEFTGGTNVGKDIYAELAKAGIGTILQMHIPEEDRKEMQKYHMNAIDCGHIPADSIGANIFLDELENRGVEVVPCSGLIRVKRKVKN